MLVGLLALVELGRELLGGPLAEACSTNRLASRHSPPAKPLVWTVAAPFGSTMISMTLFETHLRPGS